MINARAGLGDGEGLERTGIATFLNCSSAADAKCLCASVSHSECQSGLVNDHPSFLTVDLINAHTSLAPLAVMPEFFGEVECAIYRIAALFRFHLGPSGKEGL
jgi:hypothetical protein